jgi:hypothetical protein
VDWALGLRDTPPTGGPAAVTTGIRLDEALRGFLAEQGTKRASKEDLWRLVMGSTRLRLTAYSVASLRSPVGTGSEPERTAIAHNAEDLAGFYEEVAVLVGRPIARQVLAPVTVPALKGLDGSHPHHTLLWIREHLRHLGSHAQVITEPAAHLAEQRRVPWWR